MSIRRSRVTARRGAAGETTAASLFLAIAYQVARPQEEKERDAKKTLDSILDRTSFCTTNRARRTVARDHWTSGRALLECAP
jgi:hypothetical protein